MPIVDNLIAANSRVRASVRAVGAALSAVEFGMLTKGLRRPNSAMM